MCSPEDANSSSKRAKEDGQAVPKPYRTFLFHPNVSWLEMILNYWIMPYVMPVHKMVPCKPEEEETTMEAVKGVENRIESLIQVPPALKPSVEKWKSLAKCEIGEYVCHVPVQKDILYKWGIISDRDSGLEEQIKRNEVKLIVRFPISLLDNDDDDPTTEMEKTEFGFVKVENLDLKSFALETATTLVQFHGGGYVILKADAVDIVMEAVDVLETYSKMNTEEGAAVQPLVTISVDWSNAPEYPFPNGLVESMSAVDYLLACTPGRKIHLAGRSAGAGMALPIAMEGSKKYPGQIGSAQVHAPCIDPKGASLSYYMLNDLPIVGSSWLRWCWQAYLGMKPPPPSSTDEEQPVLEQGSNAMEWQKCKWNKAPFNRLARPIEGVSTLSSTEGDSGSSPRFVVMVNKADTLYEEGMEFGKKLQESDMYDVSLFEHNGLHVTPSAIDPETYEAKNTTWANILFG